MSSYHHQSGAHKRKKKREDTSKTEKLPKITNFFNVPNVGQSSTADHNAEKVDETSPESLDPTITDMPEQEPLPLCPFPLNEQSTSQELGGVTGENIEKDCPESEPFASADVHLTGSDIAVLTDIASTKYATDRANFPITITDAHVKRFIITNGPCRPTGPFPRDNDEEQRCFSVRYYEKTTKTGLKLPITWLCYSPKLNVAYCEPCWLFGDRKKLGSVPAWAKGIQKWKGLSTKIQVHETSQTHIDSCLIYDQWRKKGTIDEENEQQIRKEKSFWRDVLNRIVNVTLTMAMNNMAFRGHREKIGEVNSGNFLAIIELLAEYDPILKQLLQLPQGKIKYLSPKIQNEVIDILSKQVLNDILSEVQNAQFYSLIIDTTQDISKCDQMSQVLRYVSIERDPNTRVKQINIHEAFLGFNTIHDQSAAGIEKEILAFIDDKGISLDKCRGQGYDGAATMSGIYSGVQTRILQREENALYVHCAAHNLNLVLQDAVAEITEVSNFMGVVQHLYTFFGDSGKRWEILSSFTSESSVTLKKLCPTRWSSRYESLLALRFRYVDVLKALSKISLVATKKNEREEAMGLKKKLESFQSIFLIVLQTKIFTSINSLSKLLQSESMDLSKATHFIKKAVDELSNFRSNFGEARNNAVLLAQKWNITPRFEAKRIRTVRKHFDELCVDERLEDLEERFKINIFYGCLDIIVSQLSNRFQGLNKVVQRFEIIQPAVLASALDDDLFKAASNLQQKYEKDLSSTFPGQLLSFRSALKEDIQKLSSVKDLAHLLLVENSALSSNLPDVCIALLLFLTLPVTVASAERSFSKLKLIKSYLRSTMSEQRLSGLAILSIENARAKRLDLNSIVDTFAELKARRRVF